MTREFGVRRAPRRRFGPVVGVAAVVAARVLITVQQVLQRRNEGVADYKAWMVSGPACQAPARQAFDTSGGAQAQVSDFGGVRFAREHGAMQCSDIADDGGRAHDTFPVCQFDRPGLIQVSTRRGLYWFWAGYMSPATIAVRHDVPSCVIGATQDFGHTLVYDAPSKIP